MSVVNGTQGAPTISRWDRGDICSSATRPARDSCTPRISRKICEPVIQKSPG